MKTVRSTFLLKWQMHAEYKAAFFRRKATYEAFLEDKDGIPIQSEKKSLLMPFFSFYSTHLAAPFTFALRSYI